jgi:hypothetical protein
MAIPDRAVASDGPAAHVAQPAAGPQTKGAPLPPQVPTEQAPQLPPQPSSPQGLPAQFGVHALHAPFEHPHGQVVEVWLVAHCLLWQTPVLV